MKIPWGRKITPAESRRRAKALAQASKDQVPLWQGDTPDAKRRRRERVKNDPDEWNRTYLAHYFEAPPAPAHREWLALIQEGERRHMPVAIAAPREHGKSVTISMGGVLRDMLEGHKKFQLIIADTEGQATRITSAIKAELEHNPRIRRDYGEQKTLGQWQDSYFAIRNGCAVMALGRGQAVRGLRHREHRPDKILLDDYDEEMLARNPTLAEEAFRRIKTTYLPALNSKTGVLINLGNLYSFNCVLNLCVEDPDQSFLIRVDKAIKDPVWDEQRRMFTRGTPLWAERYTLKDLSQNRRNVGERAWEAEYQNNPSAALMTFRPEWIVRYNPHEPPFQGAPLRYYCAIDPSIKHHNMADYKAQIVCAAYQSMILVRYAWIRRCSINEMLEATFALHQRFHCVQIGLEEEGQQLLFRKEYIDLGREKNVYLPLVPILHKGLSKDSPARISGLSVRMEAGGLLFAEGPDVGDMDLLIQQFKGFDSRVVAKDGPDATQMCVKLVEDLMGYDSGYESVEKGRYTAGADIPSTEERIRNAQAYDRDQDRPRGRFQSRGGIY